MKSRLLLIAVALACAACAGESQSSPAPAAPVGVTSAPASTPPEAAPADVTGPDTPTAQPAIGTPPGSASGVTQGSTEQPNHAAPGTAAPHASSEPRRTTPEELRPLMDAGRAILVDVRGESDWAFYRAAEAIHIPYGELRARSAELPHDALIALYCT